MKHLKSFFESIKHTPTIEDIELILYTTDGTDEGIIGEDNLLYYQEEVGGDEGNIIKKYYGWELKNSNYHGSSVHDTDYVPYSVELISPTGEVFIASGIGCPAEIQLKTIEKTK